MSKTQPTPEKKSDKQKAQCHFISNTHWDREWRFSMQRTRHMLVYMMDMLLDIFEKEPNFKSFHLDSQTVPIQDYLEIRPEKAELLKKYVTEKKLFVGPWFCLPDEFSVAGESLVRNLLLGHKIAKKLGHVSKTGYSPFGWGQVSQMPQIYKGFGIDFAAFYRGINTIVAPRSEYIWEGADGTKIVSSRLALRPRYNIWYVLQRPLFWNEVNVGNRILKWDNGHGSFKFIDGANNGLDARYTHPKFSYLKEHIDKYAKQAYDEQDGDWTTAHRFWSCGHDSSCPDIREVQMIADSNKSLKDVAEVFHSSFEDFQKGVCENISSDLPVAKGEMRNFYTKGSTSGLFGWIISARMDVKQDNFKTEQALMNYAEPLAVFASLLGTDYPQSFIDTAYNYLLQNHGHDSIGGCSRDIISDDMLFRTRQAREIGSCVTEGSIVSITGSINLSKLAKDDIAMIVFNPCPFERSEVASALLEIPQETGCNSFEILDEKGNKLTTQSCDKAIADYPIVQSPNDTANIFQMTQHNIRVQLPQIPAMGYKTFIVKPVKKSKASQPKTMCTGPQTMENEYLAVTVNSNGTLSIKDKKTGKTFDRMGYFYDTSEIGNPWEHHTAPRETVYTTLNENAKVTKILDGELEAAFSITIDWALPCGRTKDDKARSEHLRPYRIINTVTLRKDQQWVDIESLIDNTVEDHYLQVCFPTAINSDKVAVQGQFDVLERSVLPPDYSLYDEKPQTEQPMNSFVDISDGKAGLALLNKGLKAYEACSDPERTLKLTMLRGFPLRICVTHEMADYSQIEKGSQCMGKQLFRYAVMPHKGDWQQAGLWQAAEKFNLAFLIAQTSPTKYGTEPMSKSFIEVTPPNLHISAVKRSESGKGWVVRLFNTSDQTVSAGIRLNQGKSNPAKTLSPVESIKAEFALPADKGYKWSKVRTVTLEEIPQDDLTMKADGWVNLDITKKKIMTIEFLP